MSALPSETGVQWSNFEVTHKKRTKLFDTIRYLDTLEPEQFAQHDGICPVCNTPFYGILDESKLIFVPGYLEKKVTPSYAFKKEDEHGPLMVDFGFNLYETKQLIVRSGLFSREQLSGTSLFNQHELEVNDRSFLHVRPKRCDCCFGSPELDDLELGILAEFSDSVDALRLDGPDLDFVSGRPVRTGFRRRSAEAIRRRRKRGTRKDRTVADFIESVSKEIVIIPVQMPQSRGTYLGTVNPVPVTLSFKDSSCLLGKPKGPKRPDYRVNKVSKLNKQNLFSKVSLKETNKRKYWYFLRKQGFFRISVHNHHKGG